MNTDQATTLSSNQDLHELTVTLKPVWHRPNVTRIEIKRTMSQNGSAVDGCSGSTQPSC